MCLHTLYLCYYPVRMYNVMYKLVQAKIMGFVNYHKNPMITSSLMHKPLQRSFILQISPQLHNDVTMFTEKRQHKLLNKTRSNQFS